MLPMLAVPISYRGLAVGQVDNVELTKDGKQVELNLTIDEVVSAI